MARFGGGVTTMEHRPERAHGLREGHGRASQAEGAGVGSWVLPGPTGAVGG